MPLQSLITVTDDGAAGNSLDQTNQTIFCFPILALLGTLC